MMDDELLTIYFKGNDLAFLGSIPEPLIHLKHISHSRYTSFLPKDYFYIIKTLNENFLEYKTSIKFDFEHDIKFKSEIKLHDFQEEAVKSWFKQKKGTIILPTGSGKTIIALEIIKELRIKTLIVVPTLVLIQQWKNRLETFLSIPEIQIGEFGGGKQDIKDITIITYDSAYLYTKRLRQQFGCIILDESHHLTGNYETIAKGYIAPYRLALTATLEREELAYQNLMENNFGPIVYEKQVSDLTDSKVLSDYKIITKKVKIEEIDEYKTEIEILRNYIKKLSYSSNISIFQQIIFRINKDPKARIAYEAYKKARDLSFSGENKIKELEKILDSHSNEKMIIFSDYVAYCEKISRIFLIPCITHKTDQSERNFILDQYKRRKNAKLVTSKVLDEGIDIPDAKIGVILIGSSSTRQFVQRLGRILRRHPEKEHAILYEIISEDTLEERLARKRKSGT